MTNQFKTTQGIKAPYINLDSSTTEIAPLNIPHGVAPSTPIDGDLWTTTDGVYGRINNETVKLYVETGNEITSEYVDSADFLNNYPKINFNFGDNEALIYSDFKFGLGAQNSLSFSVVDDELNQVIYYQSTTPLRKLNVYKAVKKNSGGDFIFYNDPISIPNLNPGEYVRSMFNLGTYFAVLQLANETAPYNQTRVVIAKTKASSSWQNWELAYDVTSIATGAYNFSLVQGEEGDRILQVIYDGDSSVLRVYNESLNVTGTIQLYNRTNDVNFTDTTGSGRTGASINFGYNPYGIAFPFTWNPKTETFHQKNSGYYQQTTSSGVKQGVGYALTISWSIPKSWIYNGTGTLTNLVPTTSGSYRYNAYSDSTWDTDEGGMGTGYGSSGTATSIVSDEFSTDIHLMVHGTWNSTSAGTFYQIDFASPLTAFSGSIQPYILNSEEILIPDSSPWSKGLNPSKLIAIDNQISFIGNSNTNGNTEIYTTFSSTQFQTVARTNDTLILNSSEAVTNISSSIPQIINSNSSPGNFSTTVTITGPIYCWMTPGNYVYLATSTGVGRIWEESLILVPALPTTISSISNIVYANNCVWNGDESSPVFWALIKSNNTTYYMAKCENGSWTIPGSSMLETEVIAGNTARGDSSYSASTGVGATVLTLNGKYLFHFSIPHVGGTVFYVSTYNTVTDSNTVSSWSTFSSKTAGTTVTDYTAPNGYGGLAFGYNNYFGYFATGTSSTSDAIYIVSSKNIVNQSQQITEDIWYSTPSSRHEMFISTQSSVGLNITIVGFNLFIGGYYTFVEGSSFELAPNSKTYVYVTKLDTSRDATEISTSTINLPNTFKRIKIAEFITDDSRITSSKVFPIIGNGLPDQDNNNDKFLSTDGKYPVWVNNPIASQIGNENKILSTDGSVTLWIDNPVPDQTDNQGKLLSTNGTNAEWILLDLSDYPTFSQLEIELSNTIPAGNIGQIPFIKEESSRLTELGYLLTIGKFVETNVEFEAAKLNPLSKDDIFNSWTRFSHIQNNFNNLDNPSTQPGSAAEILPSVWSYNSSTDTITCNIESTTYVGLISKVKLDNYVHEVRLTSTSGNDNTMGVIIAWYVDPVTNIEHTLSAIRRAGSAQYLDDPLTKNKWQVVYDYKMESEEEIFSYDFGQDFSTDSNDSGWAEAGFTKIKVTREGDNITCETTDFNNETYDDTVKITFTLAGSETLQIFRGPKQYGYGVFSQLDATINIIQMNNVENIIYNFSDNLVYQYNNTSWEALPGLNAIREVGVGRLLYNDVTNKLFFIDKDETLLSITPKPTNVDADLLDGHDSTYFSSKIETEIEISKSVPPGNVGQVPFIKEESTRYTELDYIVNIGQYVENQTEFNAAQLNYVTNTEIFNSWYRFSHNTTENQPAYAAEVSNSSWTYDSVNDKLICTINSSSYIGFVSNSKIENYVHEVRLSSTDDDDDAIGVIIAWYVDPETNREYTLSAIRSAGGFGDRWRIVYNLGRNDSYVLYTNNYGTNLLGGGGWATAGSVGTKIKITRAGDNITCETTDFNSEVYDDSVKYSFSLLDDERLNKFRGAKQYGYSCQSQNQSTFTVLQNSDPQNLIFDILNNTVYEYKNNSWTLLNSTITQDIGIGRLLFNNFTNKLFYIDKDSITKPLYPTQLSGVDNTYGRALLISGTERTDDDTGSTWIFADSKGSDSNKYGIRHNQAANAIEFWGANNPNVLVDLDNGSITTTSTTTGGFRFKADPGGGSGDDASITYFAVSGEKTVLQLAVSDDGIGSSQDSINLVASGGVGINTVSPSEAFHVTGNILASGDITAFSDISLKTNIQPIVNSLDTVKKLEGVTFDRVDTGERGMGVIAQKLQQHLPDLVKTANDGKLSVNYNGLSGLFIECFKELIDEIQLLKEEITQLKGEK